MRSSHLPLLLLAACAGSGQPDPSDDPPSLIGTWTQPGTTLTFSEDGTYVLAQGAQGAQGTWSVVEDKLRLSSSTYDLRFDEEHLMFGSLMRGTTEFAAGSMWQQSSSTPGGGGSCSTIFSSSALVLETATVARYLFSSMCQPANMGGSNVDERGTWAAAAETFTLSTTSMTATYFLLGDAIGTARWDRGR